MHVIDKVVIKKLWGNVDLDFKCDKQYNFLIGENGTGKTTVINLIAATLLVDFNKLDKIDFESITIIFKALNGSRKPSIKVFKSEKQNIPFYDIQYEIKPSQSDDSIVFDLDEFESERYFRNISRHVLKEHFRASHSRNIYSEVEKYIKVNWLSVYRNVEDSQAITENKNGLSTIDLKLNNIHDELGKYFSELAKKYSDKVVNFQKDILLSIITPEPLERVLTGTSNFNIEHEKKALEDIFEVLGVPKDKVQPKILKHFDKFDKANDFLKENTSKNIPISHFAAILNAWRSHALVVEYEKLQSIKSEIFSMQKKFVDLLNKLFENRKLVRLSEKNELIFFTKNLDKVLNITELSSGEKQLIIILGQALLQHQQPTIFIADEPELSLHLKWQEALTTAITSLNPKAQIIFATHSPDIVSEFHENVIRMEDMLK